LSAQRNHNTTGEETVTTLNLTKGSGNGGSSGERPVLPADNYRMKIVDAAMRENKLEKPYADGTYPMNISLTWEVTHLTEDQLDLQAEAGEEWIGVRVWQDHNPYYGDVKAGGPSKFKAFIDALRAAGHLPNFDPSDFDIGELLEIEMKCLLKVHIRTMGANVGKPVNKVVDVSPLRAPKGKGQNVAVKQPAAPRVNNTPEPMTEEMADADVPF
jgi:hypothetical protein